MRPACAVQHRSSRSRDPRIAIRARLAVRDHWHRELDPPLLIRECRVTFVRECDRHEVASLLARNDPGLLTRNDPGQRFLRRAARPAMVTLLCERSVRAPSVAAGFCRTCGSAIASERVVRRRASKHGIAARIRRGMSNILTTIVRGDGKRRSRRAM